jgi:hypothetical protein
MRGKLKPRGAASGPLFKFNEYNVAKRTEGSEEDQDRGSAGTLVPLRTG